MTFEKKNKTSFKRSIFIPQYSLLLEVPNLTSTATTRVLIRMSELTEHGFTILQADVDLTLEYGRSRPIIKNPDGDIVLELRGNLDIRGFVFSNGRTEFILILVISHSWRTGLQLQDPKLIVSPPETFLGKYVDYQDRCSYLLEDGSYVSASLR
jgi:hypothetical protein